MVERYDFFEHPARAPPERPPANSTSPAPGELTTRGERGQRARERDVKSNRRHALREAHATVSPLTLSPMFRLDFATEPTSPRLRFATTSAAESEKLYGSRERRLRGAGDGVRTPLVIIATEGPS
jgi:hypothetical protein